jgi:hypothetical protein
MSTNRIEIDNTGLSDELWQTEVVRAVRETKFGSVEILIHEGRVVQIETRERFASTRRAVAHRTTGGVDESNNGGLRRTTGERASAEGQGKKWDGCTFGPWREPCCSQPGLGHRSHLPSRGIARLRWWRLPMMASPSDQRAAISGSN